MTRRLLLAYAGVLGSIPLLARSSRALANPSFRNDPFTLGVASGDPDSTSVVIWTRLAPRPLDPDGGMPAEAVNVRWEVASDEGMGNVVARGPRSRLPRWATRSMWKSMD